MVCYRKGSLPDSALGFWGTADRVKLQCGPNVNMLSNPSRTLLTLVYVEQLRQRPQRQTAVAKRGAGPESVEAGWAGVIRYGASDRSDQEQRVVRGVISGCACIPTSSLHPVCRPACIPAQTKLLHVSLHAHAVSTLPQGARTLQVVLGALHDAEKPLASPPTPT